MSNVLNIKQLTQENNEKFNINTQVQLTETIFVNVKVNPSEDIISKIVKNYVEIHQNEEIVDLTMATTESLQYFIIASLLKETTDIDVEFNSFEDYTDMVIQLIRAGYFKKIIEAYGQDFERIINSITTQLGNLTEVLNKAKKEMAKTNKPKRTTKPRAKNKKEEVVINGEQQQATE